jgi:hypothetical protein
MGSPADGRRLRRRRAVAVAVEFGLADAADVRRARSRTPRADERARSAEGAVVENDIGRHALAGGLGAAPGAQRLEQIACIAGATGACAPALPPPCAGGERVRPRRWLMHGESAAIEACARPGRRRADGSASPSWIRGRPSLGASASRPSKSSWSIRRRHPAWSNSPPTPKVESWLLEAGRGPCSCPADDRPGARGRTGRRGDGRRPAPSAPPG